MERFGSEYREAFLCANANQEFIAGEVEQLLRTLMRGVGSQDCGPLASKAARQLDYIIDLLQRCDKINVAEVLNSAMTGIAGERDVSEIDEARLDVGKAGLMYLVEATAHDNAARGRASKRWENVSRALNWLEDARDAHRQRRR